MIQLILIVVGVAVAVVAAVAVIGLLLPKAHTAARSARLGQSPETVWAALTDIDDYPTWRPDVRRVERLSDEDGRPRWREHGSNGKIAFEVVESVAPSRLVSRIADPRLPFGGSWTYVVTPTGDGGSTVTVTEDGEVYNPIFRFVSRFVTGHTATMDKYLKALGAKFGESVTVGP
ncbi:MAG TPA: SRPBCC family protein [Pilimelia sp.]|nr:SRPBCC family protein [Pilimelia sp.]